MQENPVEVIFRMLSVVNSEKIQDFLLLPKLILMPIGLFFLFFLIYSVFASSFLHYLLYTDVREFLTYRAFGVGRMTRRWQNALARLETGNEAEYKLAIIEVDAMLDEVLVRLGFRGATTEERLRGISPTVLSNLPDLLSAHRTRNNIVHDPNFILSLDEARKTMAVYEQAFLTFDLI